MPDIPVARILIVDDETAQMKALCDTLRDHGYDTTGFTSGKAALQVLEKGQFDLLLTDLIMPEMDGINLLGAALKVDANLVGIIMTGHATVDTAVQAMKTGALDYILKPFKLSAILPVLRRALTVRRLRVENEELALRDRGRTAQLEAVNQELEAYSSSVSHDLRAPLRRISAFVELLTESTGSRLTQECGQYLCRIKDAAQRMGQLIDDLLSFSRMGRVQMRTSLVHLESTVEEALSLLDLDLQGRNLEWKKTALPCVKADSALMRQVFINLLSNALKYTRPRNPAQIEIGCIDTALEETVIFVRDNGVGFDMAHADKLFGVFQRLHGEGEFEGTGIGLANVRRIISRHGGRVWAESKVNEGATFYFSLPKSNLLANEAISKSEAIRNPPSPSATS